MLFRSADVVTMLALEQRFELQPERQLDRFTRGPRRRDDDDPASRRFRPDEGVVLGDPAVLDLSDHAGRGVQGGGRFAPLS